MSNKYIVAKEEADKIDAQILEALRTGRNFKVEAGAGSGKTFSLMKVVEYLQNNRKHQYINKYKKVACITYTNAAVNVIQERLMENSFIIPSTIHSFAWENIKQFQNYMIKYCISNKIFPEEVNSDDIKKVNYTLGIKFFKDGVLYLHHNDVMNIFVNMMDLRKFRIVLSQKYPLILIDEYQDSFAHLINKFIKYFIEEGRGIQFGFFGDSWQTIYKNNNAIGCIKSEEIQVINKTSNFRCSPEIVNVLNKIRPNFKQISALDEGTGYVKVIHCNDFTGERRTDRYFTNDLPEDELHARLDTLKDSCEKDLEEKESLKILMITHKMLSLQQNYSNLLTIMGDGFKNQDDPLLMYVMNTIIPLANALNSNNISEVFEILKQSRKPIHTKAEKKKWLDLNKKIQENTNKTIKDMLSCIIESNIIPIPSEIIEIYNHMLRNKDNTYRNSSYEELSKIPFSEFEAGVNFLKPDAVYSTEHGVKGEEYSTVIFVIGRGWNLYQFDKYMPMGESVSSKDINSYERNRNLFYVCCSRPIKKLIIFVTIELEGEFKYYLEDIVGANNVIAYNEYVNSLNK